LEPMASKSALAGAVLVLQASVASAAAGDNCSLTSQQPKKARYLKFCQDYNQLACCIPGHDLENQVQFENLIEGLGPGCKNPMMYPEVRFFYCLGCDPDQPKYTEYDSTGQAGTINICKSFLDKLWRDPAYEECGVMYSNPCPDPDTWDFDPYMCGDTLVLPKHDYNGNVTHFINVFKPPGLENYDFVEIDDTLSGNDATPCWMARTYSNSGAARATSPVSWAATAALATVAAAVLQMQQRR